MSTLSNSTGGANSMRSFAHGAPLKVRFLGLDPGGAIGTTPVCTPHCPLDLRPLMRAVLERAWLDATITRQRKGVREWLDDTNPHWAFSLLGLCEALGLPYDLTRAQFERLLAAPPTSNTRK